MRRANWMSFGIIVTRLAWMAHKLVSSNRPTKYASAASWTPTNRNTSSTTRVRDEDNASGHTCNANTAVDWKRKSVLNSCANSRTKRWKGSLRINNSVDFWYLRISRKATVPGR
jgi:hypothetical protein